MIYGDEDACSARGERYDPLFKPDFSPELLRHRPYVAGACAIRRERCVAMGGLRLAGWLGVIDLALRIALENNPALVAHARGIVVHRLDGNIAELESPEFRRRMNELVAEDLRRAGGEPMRLAAAGGAPAMWSHQPPSAAAITFYVRCGGAAQDAAACLEALVPGVAARIAEVMIDIPAAHGAELAAGLRRHGCHAPLRVVAARGGEALAQAFEQAKGDWIAVVDARCRAFASGWLERLEQGVVGRFTAGIAAGSLPPSP